MKIFIVIMILSLSLYAQAAHEVDVTYTASVDAGSNPTLAYNIYRANADCSTPVMPAFIKQNPTPISGTFYADTNVLVGSSYCYKVRSFLNSLESVDSNTANAVVLQAPPTGVTAVQKQ